MRKTKIVATIGPASDSEEHIEQLIKAGVNVFRFNMKHSDLEWHGERMQRVDAVSDRLGIRVGVLIDLQGPEVRIASLPEGMTEVKTGDTFWFGKEGSDCVVLDHPDVLNTIKEGQVIYANDGFLEFVVVELGHERIRVEVVQGDKIATRKTVNFPGAELDFPTLTDVDLAQLELATHHHVDFVALSFVRNPHDVTLLREELKKLNLGCKIVAKIEHPNAVDSFDAILEVSDAIMVARGDLGLEYPLEQVPVLQKQIVHKCVDKGKPVIVATQMLESMTDHPRPTRAEVSDVANAIYDGADAVMLSGETAGGQFPVKAVKIMALVAEHAEKEAMYPETSIDWKTGGQTAAIVGAADRLAELAAKEDVPIQAFVALTETGKTVSFLARMRPELPILAVSGTDKTLDQLTLTWGAIPVQFGHEVGQPVQVGDVVRSMAEQGKLHRGDKVIVIHGDSWGASFGTSIVRIQTVE